MSVVFLDTKMIKVKLKAMIDREEQRTGRRIPLTELSDATGINRVTLGLLANHEGHNFESPSIDALCTYFGCEIEELLEHVPDQRRRSVATRTSSRAPKRKP